MTTTTTNTNTKTPAIDTTVNMLADNIGELVLTFANGEVLRLRTNELGFGIVLQATMHGLKQKLVDAAAISRNPDTGRSATIEDKFAAVKEVYDRLLVGEWNKRREAGTGTGGQSLLLAAMCKLYADRKTEAELREWIKGLTDEEQSTLRSSARVAPIIAEIKAARDAKKTKGVDADALFAELDGE